MIRLFLINLKTFSYFQIDQKYYLFFYGKKRIDLDFLYQAINVIQELDTNKRKLRSLRGFFLYALEMMRTGEKVKDLATNVQPFFWKKVEAVIRQNKKGALIEFLFGSSFDQSQISQTLENLEKKIQILQNEINFLKQKIYNLENNQSLESNVLSEGLKTSFKRILNAQLDDNDLNQKQAQNEPNFKILRQILFKKAFNLIKEWVNIVFSNFEDIESNMKVFDAQP